MPPSSSFTAYCPELVAGRQARRQPRRWRSEAVGTKGGWQTQGTSENPALTSEKREGGQGSVLPPGLQLGKEGDQEAWSKVWECEHQRGLREMGWKVIESEDPEQTFTEDCVSGTVLGACHRAETQHWRSVRTVNGDAIPLSLNSWPSLVL